MSLLNLPTEIHLLILTHLDPFTTLCLRLSCTHFHALIPAPTTPTLFEAEKSPHAQHLDILACTPCGRLLPSSRFTQEMISGFHTDIRAHKPGHAHVPWRFCVACGSRPLTGDAVADYDKYLFSVRWEVNGRKFARCARCRLVKDGTWIGLGEERQREREWAEGGLWCCEGCEPLTREERNGMGEEVREMVKRRWRVLGQARAPGRG